jgi:hypothetical protein
MTIRPGIPPAETIRDLAIFWPQRGPPVVQGADCSETRIRRGSWRSALLILTLSLVIIAVLTYVLHLASGLVYVLLLLAATLAGLVWNQVLGHRR